MENIPDFGWLAIAYVTGSIATYFLMYRSIVINAIDKTIDNLIEAGYLKATKNSNGEVLLHKHDE